MARHDFDVVVRLSITVHATSLYSEYWHRGFEQRCEVHESIDATAQPWESKQDRPGLTGPQLDNAGAWRIRLVGSVFFVIP